MYTHETIKTGQRCFQACWWPHEDPKMGPLEKAYPLMMFESGQCNRVNAKNLKKITKELV